MLHHYILRIQVISFNIVKTEKEQSHRHHKEHNTQSHASSQILIYGKKNGGTDLFCYYAAFLHIICYLCDEKQLWTTMQRSCLWSSLLSRRVLASWYRPFCACVCLCAVYKDVCWRAVMKVVALRTADGPFSL